MTGVDPLLDAVERLAASPDDQAAYLRRGSTYPSLDELALEFDDAFRSPAGMDDSPAWRRALRHIDAKLASISGPENAKLWQVEALEGYDWSEVREIARRALATQ